jgi:hypothetical protein
MMFFGLGLLQSYFGCNSFICPNFNINVVNITSISISDKSYSKFNPQYQMQINFDVCESSVVGFAPSELGALQILSEYNLFVGNTYDAYMSKYIFGNCIIKKFPLVNGYENGVYDDGSLAAFSYMGTMIILVSICVLIYITLYECMYIPKIRIF